VPGLQATLDQAFAYLGQGAADPGSPFHTPTLATNGPGAPQLRTVILRRFLAASRQLEFHTDARSAKVPALLANPLVGLHIWDAARRVQLRLAGTAALLDAPAAAAIWRNLSATTQSTYAVNQAPGTPIAAPNAAARSLDATAAQACFRVVLVRIDELEWLHLAPSGHERARFSWAREVANATWLVP
jgi:pyridoxamine 5'-phosphate oxidase